LNLLQELQQRFGLALLFISHDLGVVDLVCDDVIVLYQGRIVEHGAPEVLFRRAAHPYTRALMLAVPRLKPGPRRTRPATVVLPAAAAAAEACAFAPRCPWAEARCRDERPLLRSLAAGHAAACHRAEAVAAHMAEEAAEEGAAEGAEVRAG
jgi:peptide/nickel transport system ATP-binding protein